MAKLFYSFDDGNLYHLDEHCSLEMLMKEQCTQNGVLIYAEGDKFELVEYNAGREVEFDTRFLVSCDKGTAVLRKTHIVGSEPKTALTIIKNDNDREDYFERIRKIIGGM